MLAEIIAVKVPSAIITARLLETAPGIFADGIGDTVLVAGYLCTRALAEPTRAYNVLGRINSVVDYLLSETGSEDDGPQVQDLRQEYTHGLCTLVATHSQSCSSAVQWKSSPEDETIYSIDNQEGFTSHVFAAAAFFGIIQLVKDRSFIDSGVSTAFGTPMECAAKGGHRDITEILLDLQLNTHEYPADLQKPLCTAARAGHYDVVCLFMETKYRDLLSDVETKRVIDAATQGGHPKIILLLIESIDNDSVTSLSNGILLEASCHGQIDLVRLALDTGAGGDSYEVKAYYNLALQRAASQGHVDVVELLLMRGNNYLMSLNRYHALVRATRLGFQRTVQMLLDHGANVNELAADGLSPLEAAAAHGQAGMVEFLINKVNIGQYPDIGISALLYAASSKSAATIRVLAQHGIVVDDLETKFYIMHAAQCRGDQGVIQALIDIGMREVEPSEMSASESDPEDHPIKHQAVVPNRLYHRKAVAPPFTMQRLNLL